MELTLIHMHNIIHDKYKYNDMQNIIKTSFGTYLWNDGNSTNHIQAFHEPPNLRPCCSSRSAVGHPWAGTKLHPRQGNPRLGWGYRKIAQCIQKDSLQEHSYAHYSQTLIPHMHVPPGSIHLHKHSPSVLHLPLWVSATGQIRKSQSFVAGTGLSLGENHFPTNSLTWRELITGLTTFFFYHGPENLLL